MSLSIKQTIISSSLFAAGIILQASGSGEACSRVLYANNGQAVLVGRNLDWPDTMHGTDLWVLPRGIKRDGLVAGNAISWTAKYGSIVAATYLAPGKGAVSDGMNEKGLAANMLWLSESDYGKRDEKLPGLAISLWAQYVLDNFSSVDMAVDALSKTPLQIETLSIPAGTIMAKANLHLSIEDQTGDSAIIEYIGGKMVIHHDMNYTVMTNDPVYEKQLENLKKYEGFGGKKPLPGTSSAEDRFVRAAYYLKQLPKPADLRQAIAEIISIARNVSQPFGTTLDPKKPNASATQWRTVADMTNKTYFFELTTSPYLIWAELGKFNIEEGSSAMKLDLSGNKDLVGNVSGQFAKAEPFEFIATSGPKALLK